MFVNWLNEDPTVLPQHPYSGLASVLSKHQATALSVHVQNDPPGMAL